MAPAWVQQAYIKASNPGADSEFARAVALSADGSTLVVGSALEDSNAVGINGDIESKKSERTDSGAVYVFAKSSGAWVQQAHIKASNADKLDRFGYSVAISADGNTVVVGAINEDSKAQGIDGDASDDSRNNSGAAYVYTRTAGVWTQNAYVKPSNVTDEAQFGTAVAMSGDASTFAVGASDGVYVFVRQAASWAQQAMLTASNMESDDRFGRDGLAMSHDGNTLAIGASHEDSNATGVNGDKGNNRSDNSGAVYVFVRTATTWSEQAYLKALNTGGNDAFGEKVALSADGNTLAVAAPGEDSSSAGDPSDNKLSNSGAVYVWARSGNAWAQQAYLKASNLDEDDAFGQGLALSADGNTLAVGAPEESSQALGLNGDSADNSASRSGAVYVFTRSGANWVQKLYAKASNTQAKDQFGASISLNADGTALLAGAHGEDSKAVGVNGDQTDNSLGISGAAYLFVLK